jgi:hypothetical protein
MRAGKDEYGLVGIGQQDLLVFALRPGIQADQGAYPILHLLDRTGAIGLYRDLHAVTDGGNVPEGTALFQPPAQLANNKARPGLHCEETGLGLDDETTVRSFYMCSSIIP